MNRRELFAAGTGAVLLATPARVAAGSGKKSRRTISVQDFGATGNGKTDDTAALQAALDAAFKTDRGRQGGRILVIPPGAYVIRRTLSVDLKRNEKAQPIEQTAIHGHGAVLLSEIDDGTNVLRIASHATARFLIIEGLSIRGKGREGSGLVLDVDRERSYLYNFCLRDLVVEGCGGDGLRMTGNIFEGQIFNSYFRDNKGNGAAMGHGETGGVLSAVHVFGSVFGGNSIHGAALVNKACDVSFHGCYFLENGKFGLSAPTGCTLLSNCGFENNQMAAEDFAHGDAGIRLQVFGTLVGCTAYSIHKQTHLIRAFVTNHLVMVGCTAAGGGGAEDAKLARLDGTKNGMATLIGCQGKLDTGRNFNAAQIGQEGDGARFGGRWDDRNLFRLGEYVIWVDRDHRLRLKRGTPLSDEDGAAVGT